MSHFLCWVQGNAIRDESLKISYLIIVWSLHYTLYCIFVLFPPWKFSSGKNLPWNLHQKSFSYGAKLRPGYLKMYVCHSLFEDSKSGFM